MDDKELQRLFDEYQGALFSKLPNGPSTFQVGLFFEGEFLQAKEYEIFYNGRSFDIAETIAARVALQHPTRYCLLANLTTKSIVAVYPPKQ